MRWLIELKTNIKRIWQHMVLFKNYIVMPENANNKKEIIFRTVWRNLRMEKQYTKSDFQQLSWDEFRTT